MPLGESHHTQPTNEYARIFSEGVKERLPCGTVRIGEKRSGGQDCPFDIVSDRTPTPSVLPAWPLTASVIRQLTVDFYQRTHQPLETTA